MVFVGFLNFEQLRGKNSIIVPYILHQLAINVINKQFNSTTNRIEKGIIAQDFDKTCKWRTKSLPSKYIAIYQ